MEAAGQGRGRGDRDRQRDVGRARGRQVPIPVRPDVPRHAIDVGGLSDHRRLAIVVAEKRQARPVVRDVALIRNSGIAPSTGFPISMPSTRSPSSIIETGSLEPAAVPE